MAGLKNFQLRVSMLAMVLVSLLIFSPATSARPLNQFHSSPMMMATEPHLNMALQQENSKGVSTTNQDTTSDVLPCEGLKPVISSVQTPPEVQRFRRYAPLVLNILPKGMTPPSGPSRGTNTVEN